MTGIFVDYFVFIPRDKAINPLFPDIEKVFACGEMVKRAVWCGIISEALIKMVNKEGVSTIKRYTGTEYGGGG